MEWTGFVMESKMENAKSRKTTNFKALLFTLAWGLRNERDVPWKLSSEMHCSTRMANFHVFFVGTSTRECRGIGDENMQCLNKSSTSMFLVGGGLVKWKGFAMELDQT